MGMFNLPLDHSIYVQARGFQKTAELANTKQGGMICLTAVITCAAFASELYLKCLILLETGQLMKGEHNLRKLFSKLPDDTQQRVERTFNAITAPRFQNSDDFYGARQPKSFRDALKHGAEAFINWRYIYEANQTDFFALFSLPKILCDMIDERKPAWKHFNPQLVRVEKTQSTSLVLKTQEPTDGAWPIQLIGDR